MDLAATCNPTGAASSATDSRYCGPVLNNFSGAEANAPVCGT